MEDDIVLSIGKRQNKIKLSIIESVPVITASEGDDRDTWHVCVNRPYRKIQFSKQLDETEAINQLRRVKQHYEKLARQIQREIDWITGEPKE